MSIVPTRNRFGIAPSQWVRSDVVDALSVKKDSAPIVQRV
jgi:hypothetical protein